MYKRQVEISNYVAQILKTKRSYVRRYIQMNSNSHFQLATTEYEASFQAASVKITTSNRKRLQKYLLLDGGYLIILSYIKSVYPGIFVGWDCPVGKE